MRLTANIIPGIKSQALVERYSNRGKWLVTFSYFKDVTKVIEFRTIKSEIFYLEGTSLFDRSTAEIFSVM